MKSPNLKYVSAVVIGLTCALTLSLYAQDQTATHHHYKLVNLGTFGGPSSHLYGFTRPINRPGVVTGCADTGVLDPNFSSQNPYFGGAPYLQHSYSLVNGVRLPLHELPGGSNTCTQWINDSGLIVGASDTGEMDPLTGLQQIRAVLWDRNGKVHNLGTLGGNGSVAWAINNAGQVTGNALNDISDDFNGNMDYGMLAATQTHAFLWEHGMMRDLGTLGGPDSGPYAINERGQVLGLSTTDSIINSSTGVPTTHPFFWNGTHMIDLGSLGGTWGFAVDVNNRGQVTGNALLAGDDISHAFLWPGDNDTMIDLPTLGGTITEAKAINSSGDVTGAAFLPGGTDYDAVLWRKGEIIDLGVVPGDVCAEGMAINAKGQVVGYSNHDECHTANHAHGFLWEHGTLFDLNQLVSNKTNLIVYEGVRINDRGEIAGNARTPNGNGRAVVLIPCDERHPDVKGCDYSAIDDSIASKISAARQASAAVTGGTVNRQAPLRRTRQH